MDREFKPKTPDRMTRSANQPDVPGWTYLAPFSASASSFGGLSWAADK